MTTPNGSQAWTRNRETVEVMVTTLKMNNRCVFELSNLDLVKQYAGDGYAADMVSIAGLNAWMTPYTRSGTTKGRNRANAQYRR